jgi:Zn-dependent protease
MVGLSIAGSGNAPVAAPAWMEAGADSQYVQMKDHRRLAGWRSAWRIRHTSCCWANWQTWHELARQIDFVDGVLKRFGHKVSIPRRHRAHGTRSQAIKVFKGLRGRYAR